MDERSRRPEVPSWTFFTNHGHVLICIAQQPDVRLAEIAARVGIGERAAHRIVHDLVDAGYLSRRKVGRRNVYELDLGRPLRHPLEAPHLLREVVEPIVEATTGPTGRSALRPEGEPSSASRRAQAPASITSTPPAAAR